MTPIPKTLKLNRLHYDNILFLLKSVVSCEGVPARRLGGAGKTSTLEVCSLCNYEVTKIKIVFVFAKCKILTSLVNPASEENVFLPSLLPLKVFNYFRSNFPFLPRTFQN